MNTTDISQVAGFKAVDADGNELGIMSMADITAAVKESIMQDAAMARSVSILSETSTLAATDTYEDQLPQQTDLKWARALDANGNPILISKESLATVLGGLLGNPIGFKQVLTHSDDLNNIYDGVFSYLNEDKPSNSYGTNTMLIQLTTKGRVDKWQVAFCANERKVAIRLNYSGNWGHWKDIVTGI